jgi:hypothetical protein
VRRLTGADGESRGYGDPPSDEGGYLLPAAFDGLESAVLDACAEAGEWPAQVGAAIYAGVDFAVENPAIARILTIEIEAESGAMSHYERVIRRLAGFIRAKAPVNSRMPVSTDEALVAGIVGLVGDHIRLGRTTRLLELRPELVLLALLPYLGFPEAQRWANSMAQ